jgi:zinc/manganese transport system ATP-binding protein
MAAITIENLTVSYLRHPAIHHISGHFASGSLTALTGPNGGGKSTLLKTIAGLMKPDEGNITIHNPQGETTAYLPQASAVERDFPISVLQLVASGAWQQAGAFGTITSTMKAKAMQALTDVCLEDVAMRDIASLSSGQFQRALFARLIMQDAAIILLDEPFNAMDMQTTAHLLDIIKRWHQEKRTIICILHDLEQIRTHFPECILLARECLAWGNTGDVLQHKAFTHHALFHEHQDTSHEICWQAS